MAKKLRIGILGTGNIARQFGHGVLRSYRCTLGGIGSRSAGSAAGLAEELGVDAAHAHGSYEALLADAGIDAVYVSLPNALHREWTIRALRAGKHVLCEKPFALDAAEAEEMFDTAESVGRVVMEAFMYLCHPQTAAVLDAIHRGQIGEVKLIRTNFTYCTNKLANNVRFDRRLGGGALMDVGCYCISLARLITAAEPSAVHAVSRAHRPTGVDELTSAVLAFPNGVQSTFTCGMLTHGDNAAHISGTEGWLQVDWPWKPAADKSGYILARNVPPRQDQALPGTKVATVPGRQMVAVPADGDLFGLEADEFASAVLDGATPRVGRDFTLGNMRVLDEIRRQIGLRFD